MKNSDCQKWLKESGATDPIELAQCLDDLCDGLIVSEKSGYQNCDDLIFKLRCLSLEIDHFPLSDFEGTEDAFAFYMMPERQRDTARLIHNTMLTSISDGLHFEDDEHAQRH